MNKENVNKEKWFVIKNGKGKFCPRYSSDIVGSYWPFGPAAEFDHLETAVTVLKSTKEYIDKKKQESVEEIVFEL